ncbi:ribonuclease P protein component [Candidatus Giovannonibacteria bacterium RIFCSPLOWO2_01_FULL_46_13]|uniref:Ribonuclease P protein component n=1 Tax=Candidatus Giovannonibacteria bacterium RIFCSPLOWO2_01_FULL_46_13 TaxID=1798352 RepID=A0A1F5X481_9BACT|nr:MAG: ribonuclease P protein component [Candidatus Giovannonibacteria bacterium RIFCSPLOWO2_01_FULL_46_13]
MLPKPHRLSRKDDIEQIAKGRGVKKEALLLKFSKNGLKESRFAFIIPSKKIKKATERNLVKRRARNIIRKNLKNIKGGSDILFIFSANALELDYAGLEKELLSALSLAKLL